MTRGKRPVVVGITGASGHLLARRCIEQLLDYGYPVILVSTGPGRRVWREELDEDLRQAVRRWEARDTDGTRCDTRGNAGIVTGGGADGGGTGRRMVTEYAISDIGAPIASGGLVTMGMLVLPCSMGTLAGIATGAAGNLLERAADVTIKEYRPLVLVPRETPLSAIHLENMLKLARLGVRIVPPMPAFYLRPQTVAELVEHLVPRVLCALGIPEALDEPPAYVPYVPAHD